MSQIPGPGAYTSSNKLIGTSVSASFPNDVRENKSLKKSGKEPGPGNFEILYDWSKISARGMKFRTADRSKGLEKKGVPSPANYNL